MHHDDSIHRHVFVKHKHTGISFPVFLIIVGLIFLGVNTGWIPMIYKPLFQSWPLWVFFGGLFFLLKRVWFLAIAMLSIGVFYLIPQIHAINPNLNIPDNFTQVYWPLLLVVAGLYILIQIVFKSKNGFCCGTFCSEVKTSSFDSEDGYLKIKSSFDSRRHIVMDPVFHGGHIETGFGEVVVDLRKTNLPVGKTYLKVKVSFGEAQIIVPMDWNVQLKGQSAFGSFVDARINPTFNPDSESMLFIEGECSFGECRIRD